MKYPCGAWNQRRLDLEEEDIPSALDQVLRSLKMIWMRPLWICFIQHQTKDAEEYVLVSPQYVHVTTRDYFDRLTWEGAGQCLQFKKNWEVYTSYIAATLQTFQYFRKNTLMSICDLQIKWYVIFEVWSSRQEKEIWSTKGKISQQSHNLTSHVKPEYPISHLTWKPNIILYWSVLNSVLSTIMIFAFVHMGYGLISLFNITN